MSYSLRVVVRVEVLAREVVVGDRIVGKYGRESGRPPRVGRVERRGVDNQAVRLVCAGFVAGLDVDTPMTVLRTVKFDRDELVSLIDDAARSAGHCDENLSGEWVVALLEGRVSL